MHYDVVIIGASFAGLSLAHHLPPSVKVLILDMKRALNADVESTGLITEHTYQLLKSFLPNLDEWLRPKPGWTQVACDAVAPAAKDSV